MRGNFDQQPITGTFHTSFDAITQNTAELLNQLTQLYLITRLGKVKMH